MTPLTGTGGAPVIGVMEVSVKDGQTLVMMMLDGEPMKDGETGGLDRLKQKLSELVREVVA